MADDQGYVLYTFAPDAHRAVTCKGLCAGTWPPVTLSQRQRVTAGPGLAQDLFGSDPKPGGGRVVTYAGWPVYRYVADVQPGLVNGQALNLNGGLWYVISGSGHVIKRRFRG